MIFYRNFICYFSSRLIVFLLIYKLFPYYDSRFINFSDLGNYSDLKLSFDSINPLFSAFVKFLNYNPDNYLKPIYLITSSFLWLIVYAPWIWLVSKIASKKYSLLYSVILGAHPYLVLYTFKFDTSIFAIIPIALFVINSFLPHYFNSTLILFITSISSLFRNALLPLSFLQIIFNIKNFKSLKFLEFKNLFFLISIFISSFCLISQLKFANAYLTKYLGCYSLQSIVQSLVDINIPLVFSKIIGFLITPLIHLFLDLGAREAIWNNCFMLSKNIASNTFIHVSTTIIFFGFHFFLLIKLVKFCLTNNKALSFKLLMPLVILLPTFYGPAHMRYLIPLIPYLLIFIFIKKEDIKSSQLKNAFYIK